MTNTKCCTRREQCLTPGGPYLPATTEYFGKEKNGKYGLRSICHNCRNAYMRDYGKTPHSRAYARERMKHYRKTPKGREIEQRAHQKPENKERAHLHRISPEGRAVRRLHENKPHVIEWRKNYKQRPEYKESVRKYNHKRRSKLRKLPYNFTTAQWQYALEYFGHSCAACGRTVDMWTTLAADHWIPLNYSGEDNPGTVLSNMLPLCHTRPNAPAGQPSCNLSKAYHMPDEWLNATFGEKQAEEILSRINRYFRDAEDHFFGDSLSSPQLSIFDEFA